MPLTNLDKAPFPWFGGKSTHAELIWSLLGDCPHYVEPFFGSGAVLLNRPHRANRPYYSETVNDLDGFVVNFWRAVCWYPEQVADAASWPVTEADKSARQLALLRWRDGAVERLAGDATWCDPVMAGWWAWAVSVQIGAFDGKSAWTADPATGRIFKQDRGPTREPGVTCGVPHLGNDGRGVNRPAAREPGVTCGVPNLGNDGRGVNHAGTREPGVLDIPTEHHGRSALDQDWGADYHNHTMPELIRWFRHLAARLRHVRIINGDWSRLVTSGTTKTPPVRQGDGPCAIFLDPPYADSAERSGGLYAQESLTVAHDVHGWCLEHGDDPDYRIVLAGFDGEHSGELLAHGWQEHVPFKSGWLKGGYRSSDGTHQMTRDRLWSSPHCLPLTEPDSQLSLI